MTASTPDLAALRAEIRARAEKATPGPWIAHQDRQWGVLRVSVTGPSTNPCIASPDIVCSMNHSDRFIEDDGSNAAHIAACCPANILALLDAHDAEIARLTERAEAAERGRDEARESERSATDCFAEAYATQRAAEARIATLTAELETARRCAGEMAGALGAFGNLYPHCDEPDHWPAFGKPAGQLWPTVGDFRRAARVLAEYRARETPADDRDHKAARASALADARQREDEQRLREGGD